MLFLGQEEKKDKTTIKSRHLTKYCKVREARTFFWKRSSLAVKNPGMIWRTCFRAPLSTFLKRERNRMLTGWTIKTMRFKDFLRTKYYAETSLNSKKKSENLRMAGSNKRHVWQNNVQEKRIIENSMQFSMVSMDPNLEIFTQWDQKVVHFSHQQRISRRDGLSILMNSLINQQMLTGISSAR